jgi:hypothetical protein
VTGEDDEDARWDWYMHASEEEIAAEERTLNAKLEESDRMFRRLPVERQIACLRRWALEDVMINRRRLRDPRLNTIDVVTQMWRDGIRRNQIKLVKLRAWRATGVEPKGRWGSVCHEGAHRLAAVGEPDHDRRQAERVPQVGLPLDAA